MKEKCEVQNKNKNEALGMPYGTACNRLRKMVLFQLAKELGKNICYQCGSSIETVEEFSIEHKEPWLKSDNPVEKFFDLNNIAFSHLKCNIRVHETETATRSIRKKAIDGKYNNCILAMKDAQRIRELSKTMNGIGIAKLYGVSKHTVYRILRGKTFNYSV